MRILIDTNVFIHAESDKEISSELAKIHSICMKNNITLMVHPASLQDIQRDTEDNRRAIHASKFKKYPVLESPGEPDEQFLSVVGEGSRHQDKIDNEILYSVIKNAVNYLITEDKGIHKKAVKLGLNDRVLTITEAEEYLTSLYSKYQPYHLTIENIPIHELDYTSKFFDSLREDYPGFDEWFIKKSKEGRMCWCWRDNQNNLKAILIYADKNKPIFTKNPKKTMKICTFKVSEDFTGKKIGELLLKLCFEYCSLNNMDSTFVTTFPKKEHLINLLEEFGFIKIDDMDNGEVIYAMNFIAPESLGDMHPFVYDKKYFPKYYDGAMVKKFIIPIKPKYHDRLFGDVKRSQLYIDEFEPMVVEQNTIKKVYLSKSKITVMNPGDLILFYRSEEHQAITGIGIVERTQRFKNNFEKLLEFIGPRSVYTEKELKEQYESEALAILFRYVGQLPKTVSREDLKKMGIIKEGPQSIQKLDHRLFNKLMESVN